MVDDLKISPIIIERDGNKTVAIDIAAGKTGVAKCHPDDAFDMQIGAVVALSRLYPDAFEKTAEMLLKAKEAEKKKNEIAVGDTVMVKRFNPYSIHTKWMVRNIKDPETLANYAYGADSYEMQLGWNEYTVLAIASHSVEQKDKKLACIKGRFGYRKVYLVELNDLEKK